MTPERRCPYCSTTFETAGSKKFRIESTADMPPPAHVVVWEVDDGQSLPTFSGPNASRIVHECKRGVPQ